MLIVISGNYYKKEVKILKSKTIRFISLILCCSILFGSVTIVYGAQSIDSSQNISYTEYSQCEELSEHEINYVSSAYSAQGTKKQNSNSSAIIATPFFIALVRSTPGFFGKVKAVLFIGTKVKIKETSENFCKVESKNGTQGYVFKGWLYQKGDKGDNTLRFNRTYEQVYYDATNLNSSTGKPRTQVQPDFTGEVTYYTDNPDIISVDSLTGLITGKKAGTANLIAKSGIKEISIPVYCIYRWKKEWTGTANKTTTVYSGPSDSTTALANISSGKNFYVSGDDGSSAGWAYGYSTVGESKKWGFVKINDISTKGTVSQYNNLGWTYPIKDTKFKNISSVYGWRNGYRHLGFDINKGSYSTILGEKLVAPSAGKVVFVNKRYDYATKEPNYGYCIIIATNSIDFISENNLYVVYMHLNEPPSLKLGDTVSPGKEIGKIGTTGNSTGPHLHLEINNKGTNFAGSYNSDSFDKTINPMFFFLNSGLSDGYDTSNEYWYNDNK